MTVPFAKISDAQSLYLSRWALLCLHSADGHWRWKYFWSSISARNIWLNSEQEREKMKWATSGWEIDFGLYLWDCSFQENSAGWCKCHSTMSFCPPHHICTSRVLISYQNKTILTQNVQNVVKYFLVFSF